MGKWKYSSTDLTSHLDRDQWSASRPGRVSPRERVRGGRMDPRAGQDSVEERKIAFSCQESNPGLPAHRPLLYRLSRGPQAPYSLVEQSRLSEEHITSIFRVEKEWNQRTIRVLFACCLSLLLGSEGGGSMFLRKNGKLLPDYMASRPRRQYCS
jgi:hypothetical protein